MSATSATAPPLPPAPPAPGHPTRRGVELALIVAAVLISMYGYAEVGLAVSGEVPPAYDPAVCAPVVNPVLSPPRATGVTAI